MRHIEERPLFSRAMSSIVGVGIAEVVIVGVLVWVVGLWN